MLGHALTELSDPRADFERKCIYYKPVEWTRSSGANIYRLWYCSYTFSSQKFLQYQLLLLYPQRKH